MKGLYFYKLVSPYEEDVTKDCKLTVNEIDSNFITLKNADISGMSFDKENNILSLTRNSGDTLCTNLSSLVSGMTTDLSIDYDSMVGTITIKSNGKTNTISGLITQDNLTGTSASTMIVITDGTIIGGGESGAPLGISPVEKTGTYSPAKKLVNLVNGEYLPKNKYLVKGDRYLTYEKVNDYGFLYTFASVKKIAEGLSNGWRIPTKDDWDNMLNAIEPCDKYRTHNSSMANQVLGKVAGKFLKTKTDWDSDVCCVPLYDNACSCGCSNCSDCSGCSDSDCSGTESFDLADFTSSCSGATQKCITPDGIDAYGFSILPAGYGYDSNTNTYFKKRSGFWTSSQINVTDVYVKRFEYDKAGVVQTVESPNSLFSLRLVKDYNGTNHYDVESINGDNFTTVLMPSLNSSHGYAVWTSINAAYSSDDYSPVLPNNGNGISTRNAYYVSEWDGFKWIKKEMKEGDSIVLNLGLLNEKNIEYRVSNGTLVSATNMIYEDVVSAITPTLNEIVTKLSTYDESISGIEETLNTIVVNTAQTAISLSGEIVDRKAAELELTNALSAEIETRKEQDDIMSASISAETIAREQNDNDIACSLSDLSGKVDTLSAYTESSISKMNDEIAKIPTSGTFSSQNGKLSFGNTSGEAYNELFTIQMEGSFGEF